MVIPDCSGKRVNHKLIKKKPQIAQIKEIANRKFPVWHFSLNNGMLLGGIVRLK